MDKLIERLKTAMHHALITDDVIAIFDAITALTALTQDRAADDERVRHIAQYAVRAAGNDPTLSEHLVQSICRHFKTTPATQAETKVFRRNSGPDRGFYRTPDTRNPAVADRRKSAEGDWTVKSRRFVGLCNGRRVGDRARWVGEPTVGTASPMYATPPAQAPEGLVEKSLEWQFANYFIGNGAPFALDEWAAGNHERAAIVWLIRRTGGSNERS
jgi:hypothetical protein